MITQNMKKAVRAGLVVLLAATSQLALADADIGVQPSGTAVTATTNVDLRVVIPEILIFGLGPVGTAVSQITWTVDNAASAAVGNNTTYSGGAAPFTAPAPYSTTATAAIVNGGSGSSTSTNTATLPVFLFSNNGTDVTISATVAGGVGGGGTADVLEHPSLSNTIPISDFTVSDSGDVTQPDFSSGGTSTADTSESSGIVNVAGTWTYAYTAGSTLAPAGTYSARVTYVAAQP